MGIHPSADLLWRNQMGAAVTGCADVAYWDVRGSPSDPESPLCSDPVGVSIVLLKQLQGGALNAT